MKKVTLGLGFSLMAFSAMAVQHTNYVGVDVGQGKLDGVTATNVGLVVGHEFRDDYFAIALETGVTKLGDFTSSEGRDSATFSGYVVPVKAKPTFYIGDFSIAPYMGLSYVHGDVDATINGHSGSASDHDIFFTYGIEAGYDVTKNVALKVGYDEIKAKWTDENLSYPIKTTSVKVVYKF